MSDREGAQLSQSVATETIENTRRSFTAMATSVPTGLG